MQITPGTFAPFNPRSLAGGEKQGTVAPAFTGDLARRRRGGCWGKWRGGRAAPPGVLGATGKGRKRRFREGGRPAAEGIDGEGAPVDDGRREAVRELSGSEAKLAGVSSWAERLWRGGSTAGLGSPAFCGW